MAIPLQQALEQLLHWKNSSSRLVCTFSDGKESRKFSCHIDEVGRDFMLLTRTDTDETLLLASLDETQCESAAENELSIHWPDGKSCRFVS